MNHKNVTAVSLLLIAISIGYYFLVFLPKKEESRQTEVEQTKVRAVEQASSLERCLNIAQAEKERANGDLLKFAEEDNKDGKYNLSGAFKDVDKQYEQDRKDCLERFGKK